MSVITVTRPGVTGAQVAEALRAGLGNGYTVTIGVRMPRNPLGRTRPANPDTIMVAGGAGPFVRARVSITHPDGRTEIRVTPGGLTASLIVNSLGIARTVRGVLEVALGGRP